MAAFWVTAEVHRTRFHANDAYSAYLQLGAPRDLTESQIAHLNGLTRDLPEKNQVVCSRNDGNVEIDLPMNSNDIVLVTLRPDHEAK